MKTRQVRIRRRWIILLAAGGLAVGGGYLALNQTTLAAQGLFPSGNRSSTSTSASAGSSAAGTSTVAIKPASLALAAVSASGSLDLVDTRNVALDVAGIVDKINVKVGSVVKAGDVLLQLDTTELERALAQAKLTVESAKIALNDLKTPASSTDIAKYQAALAEAKANLAKVQAGSSKAEIAAARSSLASAQSAYDELKAGKTSAQLTQLSADMKKAEVALQTAQSAYDKVAWRNTPGQEAADLQSATIDYEKTKAAYAEATAGATTSAVQSAINAIQTAQVKLDDLLAAPTAADLAAAQSTVAAAEANLADAQQGATTKELRTAEITLNQALIDQETAQRNLNAARLTAPIAGTVIEVDAKEGVRSAADTVVAKLTDPSQLDLVVAVAEADIPNVKLNQKATIEIDALPGKTYNGVVTAISPVKDSTSSSVKYPVTIRLTDSDLSGVLPGMNAVATLENLTKASADSWLVPSNALQRSDSNTTVQVVRGQDTLTIAVTPSAVQGEWTVVQSPDLQQGDQVVGSLTSKLNNNRGFFGGPPQGGMPGGPP